MQALAAAIRAGNRIALSKALTLTESTKPEHQVLAVELLHHLQPNPTATATDFRLGVSGPPNPTATANDFRIGVSGPPGAGKSSLIDSLGCRLVEQGHRVAVLAVDPSSDVAGGGGSILADKTRMSKLGSLDAAYVRPSPTRGTLGGVARSTSEALLLCAAAGYSRLLVETVGVGQSEISVSDLVDCMLLVLPPVGGDELQSIKRGITEVADIIVVNKADGSTTVAAQRAVASFKATMHLRPPRKRSWSPVILPVSARTGAGMETLLATLNAFWDKMRDSGELEAVRAHQHAGVVWTLTEEMLLERFKKDTGVKALYRQLLPSISDGTLGTRSAAAQLVDKFIYDKKNE